MAILKQEAKYRSKVTITLTVDHDRPLTKTYLAAVGKGLGGDQLIDKFYDADTGEDLLAFVYADNGKGANDVKVSAALVKTLKPKK